MNVGIATRDNNDEISLDEYMVDWSGQDDPSDSELDILFPPSSPFTIKCPEQSQSALTELSSLLIVTDTVTSSNTTSNSSIQRRPSNVNDLRASTVCGNSTVLLSESSHSPTSTISLLDPSSKFPHLPGLSISKPDLLSIKRRGRKNDVITIPKKWVGSIAILLGVYSFGLFCLYVQSGLHLDLLVSQKQELGMKVDGNLRHRALPFGVLPSPTKETAYGNQTEVPKSEGPVMTVQEHRSVKVKSRPDHHFPRLPSRSKAIFYNIYLPRNNNTELALSIVKEQLKQLAHSDVELFYNTIGARHVLPPKLMDRWCSQHKIHCHFLSHHDQGMEEITLQNVYEYCQQEQSSKIGYLHNKGSHHPSSINNEWRYLMTQALVREECWNPSSLQECNACGLYFTSDRGHYFSGNVWTADCSYVRRLIPPLDFEPQMSSLVANAFLKQLAGQFSMTQYSNAPSSFGVGRYASEVWIGSHPTILPCDFSASFKPGNGYDNTKDFLNFVNENIHADSAVETNATANSNELLVFTNKAPMHPFKLARPRMMKNLETRDTEQTGWKREYFHLAGFLFRWIQLYDQLPAVDSWVWDYYPHGDWWKQAVQKHGKKVIEAVLATTSQDS